MAKASPQRARELALFRYQNALDRGDFDIVIDVLRLAERDPLLMRMIAELHDAEDARPKRKTRPERGITTLFIRREPSPNGWPPKTDATEEEHDMLTLSETTMRGHSARWQFLTAIAAAIILIVLGTILVDMANRYIPQQRIASPLVTPTDVPTPIGCQVLDSSDAQGASVRLAGDAQTLLEGDAPDTELATLLGICALQTAYTPEADAALQHALSLQDALTTFEGQTMFANGVAFSPDGQTLYTQTYADRNVHAWNLQTGAEQAINVGVGEIVGLSILPDGRTMLISPFSGGARLQNAETGELLRTVGVTARMGAQLSRDSNYILTNGYSGPATLYDTATGEEIHRFATRGFGFLSPDGRFVATVDVCNIPSDCSQTIRLYDLQSGELLRSFEPDVDISWAMAFSNDGRYLITGEDKWRSLRDDNSAIEMPALIEMWDVETGTQVRRFEGHTGTLSTLTFSPDDRYILSGAYDGTGRVWDTETGRQVRLFTADNGEVMATNLSPDGRQFAIGYESGAVVLWDTDVHDFISDACTNVSRDFTPEERAQYGLSDGVPTCPQFGENAVLPPGMTPIPTQPIPVWTPLPAQAES